MFNKRGGYAKLELLELLGQQATVDQVERWRAISRRLSPGLNCESASGDD
jgi:hypothetical protein